MAEITRDTPFPAQMGKWQAKGKTLRELPEKFLAWYSVEGQFEDWADACAKELRRRKQDDGGEAKPEAKASDVPSNRGVPLQSDHMVVASALIEENYMLVKESLGREINGEAVQAHTDTIVIALSRNQNIDWLQVEKEQRALHRKLTEDAD